MEMMEKIVKIGITGVQYINDEVQSWLKRTIYGLLDEQPPLVVGVTSLAIGTDQIFAQLILERGGTLHVVIPFAGYERAFDEQKDTGSLTSSPA